MPSNNKTLCWASLVGTSTVKVNCFGLKEFSRKWLAIFGFIGRGQSRTVIFQFNAVASLCCDLISQSFFLTKSEVSHIDLHLKYSATDMECVLL